MYKTETILVDENTSGVKVYSFVNLFVTKISSPSLLHSLPTYYEEDIDDIGVGSLAGSIALPQKMLGGQATHSTTTFKLSATST